MARHVGLIADVVPSAGPEGCLERRRRGWEVDACEQRDAALGKSVTPSLMCWQLPSPVNFANRWGLGTPLHHKCTVLVHSGARQDALPNRYCPWLSPRLEAFSPQGCGRVVIVAVVRYKCEKAGATLGEPAPKQTDGLGFSLVLRSRAVHLIL